MVSLKELGQHLLSFGSGPTLEEMPRSTLADKGLDGPTAAHRVEEIHAPFNYAYLTCTTGSSAFQNLVGVTWQELEAREAAGREALSRLGLDRGSKLLITYPPLVSVFSKRALDQAGIEVHFIPRPSRDALLVTLAGEQPHAVLGESTFLRAALVDAGRLGVLGQMPQQLTIIAAGSSMDPQLVEEATKLSGASVHDLYGCQEFGWLCLDGIPLRQDITLWDANLPDSRRLLLVGGLPTGDCFHTKTGLDGTTEVLTPTCQRIPVEPEVHILASTAEDLETVSRAARTILRIKAKILRVDEHCQCKAERTHLRVTIPGGGPSLEIIGPEKTRLFDDLLEAQRTYQRKQKTDPVWNKGV